MVTNAVDLIDRDKLLQEIEEEYCKGCDNYNYIKCRVCGMDDAKGYITAAEAVRPFNAPPVYWVKETDRTNHWHCPECGYTIGVADLADNFCPKCGIRIARKEGEKLDF